MEAVVQLLVAPFIRQSATRELRLGIARAFVTFTHAIRRPTLEQHAVC